MYKHALCTVSHSTSGLVVRVFYEWCLGDENCSTPFCSPTFCFNCLNCFLFLICKPVQFLFLNVQIINVILLFLAKHSVQIVCPFLRGEFLPIAVYDIRHRMPFEPKIVICFFWSVSPSWLLKDMLFFGENSPLISLVVCLIPMRSSLYL